MTFDVIADEAGYACFDKFYFFGPAEVTGSDFFGCLELN